MGHSVQLIVGRNGAIEHFLRDWPTARAVDLEGGWAAIPLDETLYEAIAASAPGAARPEELDFSPPGMEAALMAATTSGGGLAYVETEYWGGSGGQSAMACSAGRTVFHPSRSRGAGGPINAALRAIGVIRTDLDDAFDTIGLGHRRSMADYEPEGPVRLRSSQTTIGPEAPAPKTIPVWAAMLLIAGFVALGTWLAITR